MIPLDVLIFGGGAAGLWLLAELTHRGYAVLLLESDRLGSGQTIASQGILHGGLKYTLQGLLTPSAQHVSAMPLVWRECLAGQRLPNLSRTRVRANHCHLWRTGSIASQLGMIGARFGLHVRPETLPDSERPPVLANVPGSVARLDEQVIAPASFLADLRDQFSSRIVHYDPSRTAWTKAADRIADVRIWAFGRELAVQPRTLVFAAGAGNASLRQQLGWSTAVMQRRPLHMVLVRGRLPELNGHCVDGAKTRVTVTTDTDSEGRTVWQVGGQLSEDGVKLSPADLVRHAQAELKAVLPGISLTDAEGSTYRVDRAERAMPDGRRPESVQVLREQNVLTVWPTKLVLAPHLADSLLKTLPPPESHEPPSLGDLDLPQVALPPWDDPHREWTICNDQFAI